MSFNGKIRRRRGIKGVSKEFKVVENFRRKDTAKGEPTNRVVLYFGTLNFGQWINTLECQKFWKKIESEIDAAVAAGKIPAGEVRKIKDKLKKGLSLPTETERDERWAKLIERYPILKQ